MRITILAIGSRGDVQPLVALGEGLVKHGHSVQVIAGNEFGDLVGGAGLEFIPLGLNIQSAMSGQHDIFSFMESIKPRILNSVPEKQDAIIATFLGVSVCPQARARDIPYFYVAPIPGLETKEFPNPIFPPLHLGKMFNRFTYRLADGRVRRTFPDAQALFLEPRPTYLFNYSAYVVPRPADWGSFAYVTGYWFLDGTEQWQPPVELIDFIDAGEPPVYVGFGSMIPADPAQLTDLVTQALARAGQRGVLVSGWGGLKGGPESKDIFMADSIPFDWLFPRCKAAVHHAGAGVTAYALRAGLPSVTVPFGMDQAFWARRLADLGAGIGPLDLRKLTADSLSSSIRRAVDDEGLRRNAEKLGALIRSEDGVGKAIEIIEKTAAA